jgi:hypothetical protein
MYNLPSLETSNNNIKNPPQPILNISDFTRYFKVYVAFSSLLSIEAYRIIDREYVPFRATIPKLSMISDL